MLEAIHHLRKAIITALAGNVTVNSVTLPVYNRVPSNASAPYIIVYSVGMNETNQNRDSLTLETITRIEVIFKYDGDNGGELECNLAMSEVLNILRTRSADYLDLSADNFKIYTSTNEGVTYLVQEMPDATYFRAILELANKIQPV